MKKAIFGLVVGLFTLSACAGSQTPPPPPPTNTSVPVVSQEKPAAEEPAGEEPTQEAEVTAEAEDDTANKEDTPAAMDQEAEETLAEEMDMSEAGDEAVGEHAEEMAEDATAAEDIAPESETGVRTFVIVPEQSKASYIVAEEFFGGALDRLGVEPGLVDTIGSTQEVSGQMQLDLADPASSVAGSQFVVNVQSLTSNQSRRDNRIREANLESNRYPLAEFTITSLENVPASYTEGEAVTFQTNGDLTIRDITLPTTFDVTATLEGDTITGNATTQLTMTDFGFEPPSFVNLFSVADDFMVEVEFVFVEQ